MHFCPNYSRIAYRLDAPGQVRLTRLRCKQWSCEYCAKKNQEMWQSFLSRKLPQMFDTWYHLTLTAHSQAKTLKNSYDNLSHGIDVIMKRVRRVFGKVEYVRVYEPHNQRTALHAHIIIAGLSPFVVPGCFKNLQPGFLPVLTRSGHHGTWTLRTWFKITAQACHIGYQVEIKSNDAKISARYITKYLTKSTQNIPIKGIRRVQTSHAVGSPKQVSETGWTVGTVIVPGNFDTEVQIYDLQTKQVISCDDFQARGFYPDDA